MAGEFGVSIDTPTKCESLLTMMRVTSLSPPGSQQYGSRYGYARDSAAGHVERPLFLNKRMARDIAVSLIRFQQTEELASLFQIGVGTSPLILH